MEHGLTPKQEHTLSRKKLVYREAIRLFIKDGYEKTTIKKISDATGISVGSIYHFYANKAEILCEYARDFVGPDALSHLEITEENTAHVEDALIAYYTNISKQYEWIGPALARHIMSEFDLIFLNPDKSFNLYYMPQQLLDLIQAAQEKGVLDRSVTPYEIAEDLQTAGAGVMRIWINRNACFSLSARLEDFQRKILRFYRV